MQELISKIEQWAEDRNIINGSKPIDQAMKLFSEFGELADNVGKGRDCRDDIGDVFVVLTIILKQYNSSILEFIPNWSKGGLSDKELVLSLANDLYYVLNDPHKEIFESTISVLMSICDVIGYTLEECVQIAYDDIKDRKGVMYNGVFIKSTDEAYEDALDNIEADKRMNQKRITVDIEDL